MAAVAPRNAARFGGARPWLASGRAGPERIARQHLAARLRPPRFNPGRRDRSDVEARSQRHGRGCGAGPRPRQAARRGWERGPCARRCNRPRASFGRAHHLRAPRSGTGGSATSLAGLGPGRERPRKRPSTCWPATCARSSPRRRIALIATGAAWPRRLRGFASPRRFQDLNFPVRSCKGAGPADRGGMLR